MLSLKQKDTLANQTLGLAGSFKEQTLGRLTTGCWCHQWGGFSQTSWVATSWRHGQTSKERLSPTRTQFLSSQPPFLPALVALLLESLQALAGQETLPVSCPLPVIQVLFASVNYQPFPPQWKSCSKKAFVRSSCCQRDLPAINAFH